MSYKNTKNLLVNENFKPETPIYSETMFKRQLHIRQNIAVVTAVDQMNCQTSLTLILSLKRQSTSILTTGNYYTKI